MGRGEDAQLKILKVAVAEFSTRGFHLATLDKIATRAAVPKQLILYYFKSKSLLLKAAIEFAIGRFNSMTPQTKEDLTARAQIQLILDRNIEFAKKHADCTRLIIMLYGDATWDEELSGLYTDVTKAVRRKYSGSLNAAYREGQLIQEINFDSAARSIHFWIVGAIIDFLHADCSQLSEKNIRRDWESLFSLWLVD